MGRSPYQWQHEPVLYGWKKNGKHQWYSDRKQTTIWEFEKPRKKCGSSYHEANPASGLSHHQLLHEQHLILDPFGGSGSTLIACEQTDRSCCTIELDEKYCDVIVKRYVELKGSAEDVSVERDGKMLRYADVVTEE